MNNNAKENDIIRLNSIADIYEKKIFFKFLKNIQFK